MSLCDKPLRLVAPFFHKHLTLLSYAMQKHSHLNKCYLAAALQKTQKTNMQLRETFILQVQRGHTVLVHAAAGGVGSLLCQWANALGATVIGTVSTEEKATQATQDGCQHAIVYTKEDFVTRVAEITSGEGVHVVYDAVGKDTFQVQARPYCSFSLFPFSLKPC